MDYFNLAGYTGVAFYLGSYALLQLGLVKGSGYTYATMNLMAASLVLVSLFQDWNTASAIIQISWITLSIVGMGRVWLLTKALRFNIEEQDLIATRLATMPRLDARAVLRAGAWHNGDAGDLLTVENAPVTHLSYVSVGGAEIEIGGQVIAHVGAGEFIGEMACMESGPASATVRLSQPTRYFTLSSEALRKLVRRNPELGPHLEFAFSTNLRSKLKATNALLEEALRQGTQIRAAV